MSPEERELEELREFKRQQTERQTKAEEQAKTTAQQRQIQEFQQRAMEHYDNQISEVLQKSDLPKTPYTVKRVAELLYNAIDKGYELDVNTAVDMVRDGYMTDIQSIFGDLPPEKMLKILGDDLAKKIRKYDIEQLKARRQPVIAPEQPSQILEQQIKAQSSGRNEKKKVGMHEWLEIARKKAGVE
jgi:hypothetical protein